MEQQFRVFEQDVGDSGYSALDDVTAETMIDAWNQATRLHPQIKGLICLPHSRRDLWPNWKTGELSAEAARFVNSLGAV